MAYPHDPPGYRRVFTRYITVKGKRIYAKDGKVFSFLVPDDPTTSPR